MKYLLVIITMLFAVPATAQNVIHKAVYTDWIAQKTLKVAFVTAFCGSQTLGGFVEGYNWSGDTPTNVINPGNYHAFKTARDIGWISTGWLGYATVQNKRQSSWGKVKRILGTAMIGRDAFEWSYRTARYGNPFDYSEEHNRHSLVYFGIRNGKLTDLYFGTGRVSGPIVDMAFLAAGCYLLGGDK